MIFILMVVWNHNCLIVYHNFNQHLELIKYLNFALPSFLYEEMYLQVQVWQSL